MDGTITITRELLVKVLDSVLYPNPDGDGDSHSPWGPYGPIGPVASPSPDPWRRLVWALLNPQPLPPVATPLPDPWQYLAWVVLNPQPLPPLAGPSPEPLYRRPGWANSSPQPDPWRSAFLARAAIDQAVTRYRLAEMLPVDQAERAYEAIRMSIREFVDEYCGTRPPRWPRPWPWPPHFKSSDIYPLDLLVAGAQFQKAAEFENPLQGDFSAAADQLFETGLSQQRTNESNVTLRQTG